MLNQATRDAYLNAHDITGGDAQAAATLVLADVLLTTGSWLTFGGPPNGTNQGALEFIGTQMEGISNALHSAAESMEEK